MRIEVSFTDDELVEIVLAGRELIDEVFPPGCIIPEGYPPFEPESVTETFFVDCPPMADFAPAALDQLAASTTAALDWSHLVYEPVSTWGQPRESQQQWPTAGPAGTCVRQAA